MPDETTYTFRLIDDTAGGAGGKPAGGPGVPPVVGPGVNPRTSQRDQAESLAGGAASVVEGRQDRQEQRRQPKPPKPPVAVASPVAAAGGQLAGRLGLGGVVSALSAAAPVAAALAIPVAAGVGLSKFVGRLSKRADDIADISPDVARAKAQIELERTLASIRLGREFGPELGRIELAKGRIDLATERAKDLLQIAAVRVAQAATQQLESGAIGEAIPGLSEAIKRLRELIEKLLGDDLKGVSIFDWWQNQPHVLPPGFKDLGEAADVEFSDQRVVVLPAFNLP